MSAELLEMLALIGVILTGWLVGFLSYVVIELFSPKKD